MQECGVCGYICLRGYRVWALFVMSRNLIVGQISPRSLWTIQLPPETLLFIFFFRVILILYNRIKDSYIIFGMDKVKILLEIYNIFVIFYTESAKIYLSSNKI